MRTNPRQENIKACKRMWKKHVPNVKAQWTFKHSSIENKKKAQQQLDPYQSVAMKHMMALKWIRKCALQVMRQKMLVLCES